MSPRSQQVPGIVRFSTPAVPHSPIDERCAIEICTRGTTTRATVSPPITLLQAAMADRSNSVSNRQRPDFLWLRQSVRVILRAPAAAGQFALQQATPRAVAAPSPL